MLFLPNILVRKLLGLLNLIFPCAFGWVNRESQDADSIGKHDHLELLEGLLFRLVVKALNDLVSIGVAKVKYLALTCLVNAVDVAFD